MQGSSLYTVQTVPLSLVESLSYQVRQAEKNNIDLDLCFQKHPLLKRQQKVTGLQRFISIKLKNLDGLIYQRLDA